MERERADIAACLFLSPSSHMLQRSTMPRRAIHCAMSTILTKILINVITSVRCVFSRRENSCQTVTSVSQTRIVRTFLKTLILISRCENDVDIAFVDGMRSRLERSSQPTSQFSRITRDTKSSFSEFPH